jgi:formamidopyrimidine-DNA glycosylase
MPGLPEVETTKQGIRPHLEGQIIVLRLLRCTFLGNLIYLR